MSDENNEEPMDVVHSVAIGSDHGAVSQKEMLAQYLDILGYRVVNVGCFGTEKVDYPDIAEAVCLQGDFRRLRARHYTRWCWHRFLHSSK